MNTQTQNSGLVLPNGAPAELLKTTEESSGFVPPSIIDGISYFKTRFETAQSKAFNEKYKLAQLLEAAIVYDISDKQLERLGLNDEQVNAILDWKAEFEMFEAKRLQDREAVVADMDKRAEERKARKANSPKAQKAKKK